MEDYIVSARKYRPSTFKLVVGQQALTQTLKNAISSNKLAHAYLFSGPRGVGKTTCARIFAKTINCLSPTTDHEACNICESCVAFNEQRSYNIHELDAASNNGVDDIRALIDQVRIPPQIGKYKVYIIDEVHMLSQSAFNSFLKTLEEPPAHAIFILATTEKHKILPTILSRCQVYDFSRITIDDTIEHLSYVAKSENIKAELDALNVIAQKADGGMRDALSIFDQLVSYTNGNITYKAVIENLNILDYEYYLNLTEAILAGNIVDCLLILNDIYSRGFEGQYIINGLASHFRDLMVSKDPQTVQLFQVGPSIRKRYIELAQKCDNEFLYSAISIANECDLNYRFSKNKRLLVELAMIRLCQLSDGANNVSEVKKKLDPIKVTDPAYKLPVQEPQIIGESAAVSTPASQKDVVAKEEILAGEIKDKAVPLGSSLSVKHQTSSLSNFGVSLSSMISRKEENVEHDNQTEENTAEKDSLFTEKELVKAWSDFADSLTEEVLLKKTMGLYYPKMLTDTEFLVEVNTQINKDYLNDNSYQIINWLRRKLHNRDIKMTIKVSEKNMIQKPLTTQEIFRDMLDQNPALKNLTEELGLELQ